MASMSETPQPAPNPIPAATPGKKPKDRSPGYPAIGLRRALELAQKLWDSDKRQPVLATRAATNLGFSAKSSGGMLATAAMKKYGLLEEEGTGDLRKVKLTDAAIAMLNPSAANREQLIKEAALKPSIHAELWGKYGVDLPSDGTIRDYLVFERKFNEDATKILIGQYRDTILFAKLVESDKVLSEDETDPETATPDPSTAAGSSTPKSLPGLAISLRKPTVLTSNQIGRKMLATFKIPLGFSEAELTFTGEKLEAADFDALAEYVELFKKQYARKPKAAADSMDSPPESKPQN